MQQLSDATKRLIESRLPTDYDLKDVRITTCSAQLQPSDLDPTEAAVVASMEQAGPPLINSDNKPTILRVVAWLAHGDTVNRNGDYFVKEELSAVAENLFKAPNFGVMDFNHSAVRSWDDTHPKVLGVWYKSEYAFDQTAVGGKGAWGILATGMLFAWAYPEYSNILLGEQARNGMVNFSMACIPGGVEFRADETNGTFAVLHNPVFFTLSALDVPPADPDATGAVTEDPNVTEDKLRSVVAAAQGAGMKNEELIAQLNADKEAALQQVSDITAKHEAATTKVTELETKVAELETKLAEFEVTKAELELGRSTAVAELEKSTARIAELEEAVAKLQAELAEAKTVEAARVRTELLAQRLAKLPEDFRKQHANKDDAIRAKLEAKWTAMTDEEWSEYVEHELLGFAPQKVGYVKRSEEVGELPSHVRSSHIATSIRGVLK